MTEENYKNIDAIRTVSALAVVLLHVSAGFVVTEITNPLSINWIAANFYDSLTRFCVPFFIMISGFFLLDPAKDIDIKSFYRKRFMKVIIPLLVWSVIYIGFEVFLNNVLKHRSFTLPGFLKGTLDKFIYGKTYYHLWYMYMLAGLYLFTPFLRMIIKQSTAKELIVFTVLTLSIAAIHSTWNFIHSLNINPGPSKSLFLYWFIDNIGYFFFGYLIKEVKVNKKLLLISAIGSLLLINILTLVLSFYYGKKGLWVYSFTSPFVMLYSISLFPILLNLFKSKHFNFLSIISPLSFGIYLIHPIALDFVVLFQRKLFITKYPLIFIPIATGIIFCVSGVIIYLMRKIKILKQII